MEVGCLYTFQFFGSWYTRIFGGGSAIINVVLKINGLRSTDSMKAWNNDISGSITKMFLSEYLFRISKT